MTKITHHPCISSHIVSRITSTSDKPNAYCRNASFIKLDEELAASYKKALQEAQDSTQVEAVKESLIKS